MATRLALYSLCFVVLAACSSASTSKQTIQRDPLFGQDYIVRDASGQKVGTAIKISKDEYRFFREDGSKNIILRDPLVMDGWIVSDERGGE